MKKITFQNTKLKPVFTDKRGSIFDLVEENASHIGMVTFNKGSVRGNHYHKNSVQYSYVLEGQIKLVVSDIHGGHRKEMILGPGMLTVIPNKTIHTYTALTKARMLDITTLNRKNRGYEKDTIRVV